MNYYPDFAEFLNQHLAKGERSASWLAGRLKVNASVVSRWLNDGTRPGSPEVVVQIAEILQIEEDLLLSSTGYGYQEVSDQEEQTDKAYQPDSNTENKNGGGIHFYGPVEIKGDVIQGSTVYYYYSNSDSTEIQEESQDMIDGENDTRLDE